MAAHDYKCKDCGEVVEVKFKVGEESNKPLCPNDGAEIDADATPHVMTRVWGSVAGWVVW